MDIAQKHVDNTLGELWGVAVLEHYIGRGIYDTPCLALVTSKSGWALAVEVRDLYEGAAWGEEEDLLDYLLTHEPSTDSMGLDTVYYWPGVQVTEDEED